MPEIQFKGKEFVFNHHLSVPFRPLVPHKDSKSIGSGNLNENLVIHGDNLHALKALLPLYSGKVNCVFIDPPYNTGTSTWDYNDNVNNQIMQDWLKSNPVNGEDMLRHDKWLCMMWPRLNLIHELMADDGVIAITIDNNELPRLWLAMDSIFGEENFIACAPWLSEPSGGKEKTGLRTGHEYVLIYSKGDISLSQDEIDRGELQLSDKHGSYKKGRELNKWGGTSLRSDREGQWFPLRAPDGSEVWPIRNDGKEGHWRWGPKNPRMKAILADPNEAHWELRSFDEGVSWNGKTERWFPYEKIRESVKAVGWKTWLDNIAYNSDGTRVIKEIFGEKIFDTPKPVELIEWVISLVPDDQAIVLDSFAGSGTTAHAVMKLNAKDQGSRRFILIECEDYANDKTAERVRRVINGYSFVGTKKEILHTESISFTSLKKANKILDTIQSIENLEGHKYDSIKKEIKENTLTVYGEKEIKETVEGLGGSVTYCTLGDPIDIDKILTGENLPSYEAIGSWLFHTATGEALEPSAIKEEDFYLGQSSSYCVWLIYKPSLDFLKSRESALTLNFAEKISQQKGKKHLVFAPAKYVPNKTLLPLGVEYAPLPFALYRVEK